jgi:hypothetical protein
MLAKCPCYPLRVEASGLILFCIADIRHAFFQREKDMGKQRTALLTCMTCADTPRRWGISEHVALCFPDNIRALIAALEGAEWERDEAQQHAIRQWVSGADDVPRKIELALLRLCMERANAIDQILRRLKHVATPIG